MAIVATQTPQEDFIVVLNGDYGICFDEVAAPKDVKSGECSTASDPKIGIYARDAKAGEMVRIMVRGNPTSVDAQALTGHENIAAALSEAGIVVVNK